MCGQAGCCGSINYQAEQAFQKLLIYNSTRGIDSTGAASVKRNLYKGNLEITLAKELGNPFNLFDVKRKNESDFSDVLGGVHRVLMGHCRSSTRGEVSRRNAHPFLFENILGTHNGTLDFGYSSKLLGGQKFKTDSEAIFNEIEAVGIEATVGKLEGAYALVWYDAKDNSLNFLRNDKRTMFYAFDEKHEILFWSSEFYHLASAMDGVPHDKEKYIFTTEVDAHYCFEIPNYGQPFSKPKVAKREGYKRPLVHSFQDDDLQGWHQIVDRSKNFNGKTGSNSTSKGTSTNSNALTNFDNQEPFWSAGSGFWSRYVATGRGSYDIEFCHLKIGPWHPTMQQAWNAMPLAWQESKVTRNDVPNGIDSGWIFDHDDQKWIKQVWTNTGTMVTDDHKETLVSKHKDARFVEFTAGTTLGDKVFQDKSQKVYWDGTKKVFVLYEWRIAGNDTGWFKTESDKCPEWVPYTKYNIDSCHKFKHEGKKKKKVISFRGWHGDLLVRPSFDKKMESGCLECSRKPQWGNDVRFVDHNFFLCEFCAKNDEVVSGWQETNQAA